MSVVEQHITSFNHLSGRVVKVSDLKAMRSGVDRTLRSPQIRNGQRAALKKISEKLGVAIKASGRQSIVKLTVIPVSVPKELPAKPQSLGKKPDLDFGENFSQYKDNPEGAIKHLMNVKRGEVQHAMYRKGIGHIDFVWGDHSEKTGKGFGLSHIIGKHRKEMESIGLKPEKIIPSTIRNGVFGKSKDAGKYVLETNIFRVVIQTRFFGKKKIYLLSAFDLRTQEIKRQGLNGSVLVTEEQSPGKPLPSQPLPCKDTQKASQVTADTKVTQARVTNGFQGFKSSDKAPQKPQKVFRLSGEVGKLLGNMQAYRLEIVIAGETHSGKSELGKQIADAFLSAGFTVGWIDWEQGGLHSRDTLESIQRNVKPENRRKLMVSGDVDQTLDAVKALAGQFQVICLDSGSKIKEVTNAWIDTLRMQYQDTIWVILMQQNEKGGTRGGSAAEYDAPVVIKTYRPDKSDFRKNYAYVFKNRGNGDSMGEYYAIADKKLLGKNYDPEAVTKSEQAQVKEQSRPRVYL